MSGDIRLPAAKMVPFSFQHLGQTHSDPYAWLQNIADPEVMAYLDSENAYVDALMTHTAELQEQLYQEMRGRIQEDDSTVPERRGEFFYYSRLVAGQQYRLFCRKHGSLDAPEQILLDENQLAEGKAYCRVSTFEPSPDQRFLAYAVDTTGSWVYDLYIQDLATGERLAGPIANTAWTSAWASDNRTLFYTLFDHAHRSYQLWRHQIGSAPDVLLYEEKDEAFSVLVNRSRSGAYIFLAVQSGTTSEVRYLPADQPEANFQLIAAREHRHEYSVEHHGERFLILSNAGAENFQLMEAPLDRPSRENWRIVIPPSTETLLQYVLPFKDHLVLFGRSRGLPMLRISAPDGVSDVHEVAFPEEVYQAYPDANPEFGSEVFRLKYTSMVTPLSTIDYGMRDRGWVVRQRQEIPSGYNPDLYETRRLFADAADGAKVPISIVHRKGIALDGSNPLLLYGYGSYGSSTEATFQSNRMSLLERGVIYAIAHIRGGSELGRAWYENGRLMQKKNTFNDFIVCAESLIAQGYTRADRLAAMGGSAGGLLVSAVANMRPDLFKTIIAMVPFTNVITAMLDPNLPLTIIEYEQWGNPSDPAAFDYMLSYSPYENVAKKAYPHIYAKTGIHDLQVPYWDPAKWVAKLRALKTDSNRLVLRINKGAGHGGSSGRYDHLREDAEVYAFILDTLGLVPGSHPNLEEMP